MKKFDIEKIIAAPEKERDEMIDKINAGIESGKINKVEFKKEFKQALDKRGERIAALKEELPLKIKMQEISKILSLSYVAKTYFEKSRSWFFHRLNGNIVNEKPAGFTKSELETLDFALKDISKKIGPLSVS